MSTAFRLLATVLAVTLAAGCATPKQEKQAEAETTEGPAEETAAKADGTRPTEADMKPATQPPAAGGLERDVIETAAGPLAVTFIGHGTLMFEFGGRVVHVDPVSREGDYATLPRADLVLVTHEHGDHLDGQAIAALRKEGTILVYTEACAETIPGGIVMRNGDARTEQGVEIEAVPAYNVAHKRPSGDPFHPKGRGNGYVLTFGGTRVYVAGDTEDTPEVRSLRSVDVAFLPMNLPYTMTPAMVADAARAFGPAVLYPYHTGETDVSLLPPLLADLPGIEVRLRRLA